jgi:hypothetical protein
MLTYPAVTLMLGKPFGSEHASFMLIGIVLMRYGVGHKADILK